MWHRFAKGLAILLLAGFTFQVQADDYPAAFAAEAAIYPGGQVFQSYQDSDGRHVDLVVNADPSDVVDYYTQQLKKRGWRLKNYQEAGPIAAADLRRADKRMIISVVRERGKVVATLTLTTP